MARRRPTLIGLIVISGILMMSSTLIAFSGNKQKELNLQFQTIRLMVGEVESKSDAIWQMGARSQKHLYVKAENSYERVNFKPDRFSKSYNYSDEYAEKPVIKFYYLSERPNKEGGPVYLPAFELAVASDWSQVLIIGLDQPDSKTNSMKLFAMNVSSDIMTDGTINILNLTSIPVVLNAEGGIYPLHPGRTQRVDISGISKNYVRVALAMQENENLELVYRQKWSMRSSNRGVYFLYIKNNNPRRWFMKQLVL